MVSGICHFPVDFFLIFFLSTILTVYTFSKRISGFDMAPPASAMLAAGAAAAAAAGIRSLLHT